MKKSLLTWLLTLGVIILILNGCNNNITADPGTPPKIVDAFFASNAGDQNDTFEDIKDKYIITELDLNRKSDQLIFKLEEPDHDFTTIQFSPDNNFNTFYRWTNLDYSTSPEKFWSSVRCGWNISDENRTKFIQEDKPIYVRAIDKKGNISEIFTIEGITITDNPGAKPVINEAYFCEPTDINDCFKFFNCPINTKPAVLTEITRVNSTQVKPVCYLYLNITDPDMDVVLTDEITIPNNNIPLGTKGNMTSKDCYCFIPMSFLLEEIPDAKLSENGTYTFKFTVTDSKNNESNIFQVTTKIK